jgi:hypothetical protein
MSIDCLKDYVSPVCAAFSLIVAIFVAYMEWLRPVRIRASWFVWRDSQGIHIWLNLWNSGPIPTNVVRVSCRVLEEWLSPTTRGFLDSIAPGAARTVQFDVPGRGSDDKIVFSAEIMYTARSGFEKWHKKNLKAPIHVEGGF